MALSFLFYILQPVTNILAKPLIINGIVVQTTNYTCALAAIATLAPYTKTHLNLTEIDPETKQFLIGNPYYGLQIKTVKDMENYWFGEAIMVNI